MLKRNKIGIVGYLVEGMFGVGLAYMNYFSHLGDVSIISHTETEIRKDLDLLVIPGGPDVDVSRYLGENDIVNLKVGKPCVFRERFDRVLLPKYIENKTPILGICRGHQSVAVHFGAKLIQHMSHEENPSYDREKIMHQVLINKKVLNDSFFSRPLRVEMQGVNSIHHQVVDRVPEEAICAARYNGKLSPDYIEALVYPEYNIATVQWHPEEINDEFSQKLIEELLSRSNAKK